ncbi:hypothetical protein HYH03_005207 [Edaphochlamys debaryana]|uniref:Sugar phosphate transporter domain-containing protein n=1 Tax=Edaphochlamys debaryana TaxID=47281 RepID=A0A835Y604_9CHLO|nr:hypothetical protein HYH03_005207 [Edaphochlamys debaryana]|eukprot:KAG2496800.1 hypothetical protein HYH03_005207 [Edaphochlamys debaryana]
MTEASKTKSVKCLALILAWYVLSTGLSLYNKQLVGKDHGMFGKGAFPAPLFMSAVQFICQTMLAKATFATGLAQRTQNRRMPWSEYARLVIPNGVTTGLDIGFSNKSLVFINLSFYTMCKSTVPVFLLLFAFIWGIEKPSWGLAGVVFVIVSGLVLLVRGETKFDTLGFGLVMTASCLSGLRFTLTQVLLHGHASSAALGGPLEVLELLTPVMSITVLVFSLAWEELWDVLPNSPYFEGLEHSMLTLLVIAAGAVIAFLMVWTEYQVIKETSALTFMIAGTVKEVVTVLAAMLVMGDKLTAINGLGLVIVIIGVLLFNLYKYRKVKAADAPGYVSLETMSKDDDGKALGSATNGKRAESDDDELGPGKLPRRTHPAVLAGTGSSGVSPISAAAVAAAAAATSTGPLAVFATPLAHPAGGPPHSSHHAATGLLGRALGAGFGGRGATGSGGDALEMSPLMTTDKNTDEPNGWTPSADGAGGPSGMMDEDDAVVVSVGQSGGAPAAAMTLSGGGLTGPHRAASRGGRGLQAASAEATPLLPLPSGIGHSSGMR